MALRQMMLLKVWLHSHQHLSMTTFLKLINIIMSSLKNTDETVVITRLDAHRESENSDSTPDYTNSDVQLLVVVSHHTRVVVWTGTPVDEPAGINPEKDVDDKVRYSSGDRQEGEETEDGGRLPEMFDGDAGEGRF